MNYQTTPSVGFFEAGKLYFKNATNFHSRSRRSEYWKGSICVGLISFAVGLVTTLLSYLLGEAGSFIGGLISLGWGVFTFIASLALCIRRLHDTGRSGWFYLMGLIPLAGGIIMLVFYCSDSTEDNQWGPNPKRPQRREIPVAQPAPQPASQPAPLPPVEQAYEATVPVTPISNTYGSGVDPIPPTLPQLRGVVQVQTGPMAGRNFTFPMGRVVTVGRNPAQCDVALSSYSIVSGVHCKIKFDNRTISVVDMNSTNGTFINGNRLMPGKPVTFRETAVIQLANSNCTLKLRFE